MSLETRSNSARFKRAEQLRRWEESDMNREPVSPKQKIRKIKFSSGCVFLAACAAGEEDEVIHLLERGADINTANVDGLTALHQACIDDNLDMVEFLVEHGADVNRGDNEGWTPLHATASCGFLSIAKYLIEHGANVAAVNYDRELALDLAETKDMADLLQGEIEKQGIDCDHARSEEERLMLRDAKEWLAANSDSVDVPNPKTGATALHVSSAKGYTDVIKVLLQCGADIDKQDVDGWTPLHAAAYWGQKQAAQILVDNLADMDVKNYAGKTAAELVDSTQDADMCNYLCELKNKQNKQEVINRRQAKKRAELQDRHVDVETPTKLKRVEVEIEGKEEEKENSVEKENRVNSMTNEKTSDDKETESVKLPPPTVTPKLAIDSAEEKNAPSWRRPNGRQKNDNTGGVTASTTTTASSTTTSTPTVRGTASFRNKNNADVNSDNNEVTLRRTNSFQADPVFYEKYQALRARIQATSYPPPNFPNIPQYIIPPSSPSNNLQRELRNNAEESPNSKANNKASPVSPLPNNPVIRGSFVPPARDEESETQRKAHAKRVRETRRSTQGVTLEEIKSAEQLVKKQQATSNNNNQTSNNNNNQTNTGSAGATNNSEQPGANGDSSNGISVSATITAATTTTPNVPNKDADEPVVASHERRPSWRLRVDNGSKFKLEDVHKIAEPPSSTTTTTSSTTTTSTPSFIRRTGLQGNPPTPRPSSAPIETTETTTNITLPLRRPKSVEDKEQDKENDARNAQALATQAAIQRRRRPKRRSTGVVTFDNVEDMESEKDNTIGGGGGDFDDAAKINHQDSGSDRPSRTRSDLILRGENGEIDYKKLYEEQLSENEKMRDKLRKSEEELRETKLTLEKLNTVTSKNSLSELEKRERRAMERKLSEMEEELKQLQKLKAENERLRAENRALTRVVSKLSNTSKNSNWTPSEAKTLD